VIAGDPLVAILQVRVTRAELARLDAVAAINGQSRQLFLLTALNSAALECSEIVVFDRPDEDEAA
jgi:hypothetical protein